MNEFVEQCRSEWKRLGVPDPVANEMAAELAADLAEADAEGASAEEVLGSGAFDPRSFAARWAAERGVIQPRKPNGHGRLRRARVAAAIGGFAAIAVIGGVLLIVASPSGSTRLALTAPAEAEPPHPRQPLVRVLRRPPRALRVTVDGRSLRRVWFSPANTLRLSALPTGTAALDVDDSGADTRTVGSVLLTVGLAAVAALTILWLWAGPGPRSRSHAQIEDRPRGPAY